MDYGAPPNRPRTIRVMGPPTPEAYLTPSKRLKTTLRRLQDGLRCPKRPLRGPKEASRGPPEPQDGPQEASKRRFWWIWAANMVPCWYQNRIWKRSYVETA